MENEKTNIEPLSEPEHQPVANGKTIAPKTEKSLHQQILDHRKLVEAFRKTLKGLLIFFAVSFLFIFLIYVIPALQEIPSVKKTEITDIAGLKKDASYKKQISQMNRDIKRLSRKYNG